jgi:selenocysteine lyase/cysteine desulfurase
MECQKHLFRIPEGIHYLNCGYMSPLLISAEEKGIEGMRRKRNPVSIKPADFFTGVNEVREKFATMVNAAPLQIAVMPSVSYGMNSVMHNIPCRKGQHALTISEEFPSCYYSARRWCRTHEAELKVILRKNDIPDRGREWNGRILDAISRDTAFLVMSSVHWMNGTRFDLEAIGNRCSETGTKLIVDGSQSVGALPIDVGSCRIDALICAAYKWLMGPYSTALAYIHPYYNDGIPLEESWMSRPDADRFDRLTDYVEGYKPGAVRYDVGQSSNFISIPVLNEALRQLLDWGIPEIQAYCKELAKPLVDFFLKKETPMDEEKYRTGHLMGMRLPDGTDGETLVEELQRRKVYVSLRGSNIRISVNVFNTGEDIQELIEVLK